MLGHMGGALTIDACTFWEDREVFLTSGIGQQLAEGEHKWRAMTQEQEAKLRAFVNDEHDYCSPQRIVQPRIDTEVEAPESITKTQNIAFLGKRKAGSITVRREVLEGKGGKMLVNRNFEATEIELFPTSKWRSRC